ncbi:hypothetical protein [Rufibacter latericius]|uniref:Uncharacterized protein n=1 Tax=Rufibacter latericius TaxID=2487040 RepID=A0A3M9MAZ4_9BACT|nr:hypothetical protein [Rufibacter latericius]RNI22365.1 hypothetical protein EFB08_19830 [Rufibacter latericius]
MKEFPFEISGRLVLTVLQDHVLIVAEANYFIVNIKDHAALERVLENLLPPSPSGKSSVSLLEKMEKAKELNETLRRAGLVLDVRVNNKTYIEFGTGNAPRITANAVFRQVGSWFKRS